VLRVEGLWCVGRIVGGRQWCWGIVLRWRGYYHGVTPLWHNTIFLYPYWAIAPFRLVFCLGPSRVCEWWCVCWVASVSVVMGGRRFTPAVVDVWMLDVVLPPPK